MLHDRYYHAARAAEERHIALGASNLKARAIHLDLADRYDSLVEANPFASALRSAKVT